MLAGQERKHWSAAIREAAVRIAEEEGASIAEVRERLIADHGQDVPTSTLGGWLQRSRRTKPTGDLAQDLRSLTRRAVALCEAEMTALERHGRRPIDVDRLAKLAALLRRLDEMQAAKLKPQKPNGLAKLGGQGLEALLNEVQD